jgi:hypothetical protein
MKFHAFIIILSIFSISSFAQSRKVNIYGYVEFSGKVVYPKSLEKILPDSIRASTLINPRRDYKIKDFDNVLLFMCANGWNIASIDNKRGECTITKEITLDEKAWELYIAILKELE